MKYVKQILIALDQLLNAIAGGMADETLSARAHRQRLKGNPIIAYVIDLIFFFDKEHCKSSWEAEQLRKHLPDSYPGG